MHRPLVVLTLCFICGIIFGHYFYFPFFPLVLISIILFIAAIVLFYFRKDISLLLFLLIFLLGFVHIERVESTNQLLLNQVDELAKYSPFEIQGRVVDVAGGTSNKLSLTVDQVKFMNNNPPIKFSGRILINVSTDLSIARYQFGDRITAYGILNIVPEPANPGEFNYREYLVCEQIYGIFRCWQTKDINLLQVQYRSLSEHILYIAAKIKSYLIRVNTMTLPETYSALLNGIVLGEKSELPEELKDAFIRCGIFHLLVVSGSNVMLVALIVFILLKLFWVKRRVAAVVSIPLIILYALVAGYQPPVSRATIMSILVLLGIALNQDAQIINNVGIAAFIALFFNPTDIFSASFQLSFLTVLSIILIYPIFKSWSKFHKKKITVPNKWITFYFMVRMVLYSSIAAFIGIAPLSAYYFNIVPMISPITNLIAVPIVAVILPAGFLTGFIYSFSPMIAQIIAYTNWLLLSILTSVVNFLYYIPGSYFYVGKPSLWFIGIYYIFLLGFIHAFYLTEFAPDYAMRKKWLLATVSFILILFILTSFHPWNRKLEMTFLSIGQGDSIFLKFPNGKTMLVDGGDYSAGKRILVPYLRRQGIHRINLVILTHPHNDHVGGLIHILNNFPVETIIDSKQNNYNVDYYPKLKDIIQQKNIPSIKAERGQTIDLYSGATINILHPPNGFIKTLRSEINNNSIILQVIYGKVTTLFGADIEQETESDLINKGMPLATTIYKVPHHGSITSNAMTVLNKIRPQIAVISVGRNNWFNLPSQETILNFQQMNTRIYRTDIDGAIIIRTNGEKIEIEKMFNE